MIETVGGIVLAGTIAIGGGSVNVSQDPGCDSLATIAAEAPDSWFTSVPEPTHVIIPPSPWPKDAKAADIMVTFLVDKAGKPVGDSIVVTGTTDAKYIRAVQKSFARFRFRPATKGDCKVPGHYRQTIQYPK